MITLNNMEEYNSSVTDINNKVLKEYEGLNGVIESLETNVAYLESTLKVLEDSLNKAIVELQELKAI